MRKRLCLLGLIAAGLAVGSLVMADAASACKGKSQSASQAKGLHGKIVSVNNNSITVAVHQHQKKGQAGAAAGANVAQAATETVNFGANTRIAFVGGKTAKAATFNDLKPGEEVMIEAPGGVAQKIAIMHHEHKKKPAA